MTFRRDLCHDNQPVVRSMNKFHNLCRDKHTELEWCFCWPGSYGSARHGTAQRQPDAHVHFGTSRLNTRLLGLQLTNTLFDHWHHERCKISIVNQVTKFWRREITGVETDRLLPMTTDNFIWNEDKVCRGTPVRFMTPGTDLAHICNTKYIKCSSHSS